MKKNMFVIVLAGLFLPLKAFAGLGEGLETEQCYKKYNNDYHMAHDCISQKKKEILSKLDEFIKSTGNDIVKHYDGPVFNSNDENLTIGDVYRTHFIASQKNWEIYRKELCLGVASEIGKETYDYQPTIDQCEINLTKRHIEEIKLMSIPKTN
ncbi:lysozyme inhibitor LprI family protein [Kosakonia sp.]|uniref:lysozyme inhibitor LprI family protein n=1 Tax=Kosakonia sp. TaxID=1916651 RepID=UPI0028A27DB5|nr:lysozyme inhibitor LprI family protein [Kosakonia sp.]